MIWLTREAVLSVFAHEMTHTMGGSSDAAGTLAGQWPQGNRGESHSDWSQGKVAAAETARRRSSGSGSSPVPDH